MVQKRHTPTTDMFHVKFSKIYNDCIPLVTKKIRLHRPHKPWITRGIIKYIHKMSLIYKESITKKTYISISKYNIDKNKLIKIIRNSEKIYFVERFSEARDNV